MPPRYRHKTSQKIPAMSNPATSKTHLETSRIRPAVNKTRPADSKTRPVVMPGAITEMASRTRLEGRGLADMNAAIKTRLAATTGAIGVGVAGLTYGVIEAHRFIVRHVEVPVLAPGSSPLRILHMSDLHLLARQKAKRKFIRQLATLNPDLVINTGDNFCSADSLPVSYTHLRAHET